MRDYEKKPSGEKLFSEYSFPNEIREEAIAIKNTFRKSEQQRMQIVRDLPEPAQVFLLGSGDCYFTGFTAAEAFEKIAGIRAKNYEAYDFYVATPPIEKQSLAIGFSSSGKSMYTIQSLKLASSFGAIPVAITNHEDSPLVKESKYQLFTDAGVSYSFPTKTTTSALVNYLLLANEYAVQRKKITDKEYQEFMNDISEKLPQAIQHIVEQDEILFQKPAEAIAQSRHTLFVGSGLNRSGAIIGAAKIVETSRRHVTFSNAEEYLHLFGFAVRENDSVVVICGHQNNDREKLVVDYARKQGANVVLIGNNAVRKEFPKDITWIQNMGEGLSPWSQLISSMVCLHLLASQVSKVNGKNPDVPEPDQVDVKYVIELLYTGPVAGWKV